MLKRLLVTILTLLFVMPIMACDNSDNGSNTTEFNVLNGTSVELFVGETHIIEVDFSNDTAPDKINIGSKSIASLTSVANSEGKKYELEAKAQGETKITFSRGETVLATIDVIVIAKFPSDPKFNALQKRISNYTDWLEFGAHDPSFIEVDGKYYAFSTDVSGTRMGYQIRESTDLLHFKYAQTAISIDDLQASDYIKGEGEFQEAWDWCKTEPGTVSTTEIVTSTAGTMSFWAPDIIKGSDGKFWLYFSLTGYFGGSRSCIGLAKSENILGPYKFDSIIIKSPGGNSTPNAIDASIIYEENDTSKAMYMVYGSFFKGIHIIELDPTTGRRKGSVEFTTEYTDGVDSVYYGKRLAQGSMEGPVISYHKNVKVLNSSGEYENKNFYYLMTSYGSLTSTYNMRYARSESIFGPYVDVTGETMTNNTGNKIMGSFKWSNFEVDWNAPGHNDLTTLSNGVNLAVYHARTRYWMSQGEADNNFHYLYLSQYAFNEDGQMVINPNRYAKETLRKVDLDELTSTDLSGGKYRLIKLDKNSTNTIESVDVTLTAAGTITMSGGSATWELKGDNFVTITIGDEVFKGVVMPSWIQSENKAGLTITLISTTSGASLYLNSRF